MNTHIGDMKPDAAKAADGFIGELIQKKVSHVVWCTSRVDDEQVALYFQGRARLHMVNILRKKAKMRLLAEKENGYTVTNTDGVDNPSMHQLGLAIDVVPTGARGQAIWPSGTDPRWLAIAEIGEKWGFKWGGRWPSPDFPHYQWEV